MGNEYQRACESVKGEANQLAFQLDSARHTREAAQRLADDSVNLSPMQMRCLVDQINRTERKNFGDDLVLTDRGSIVVDAASGRRLEIQLPQVTYEERPVQPRYGQQGAYDPRMDGRQQQHGRDGMTDGVVKGVIGAATGAAIDGRKGAMAGGVGGVVGSVMDRNGGSGDATTDNVVKGVVGAVAGAAIDGKKGAIAGGAGAVVPGVLDKLFGNK